MTNTPAQMERKPSGPLWTNGVIIGIFALTSLSFLSLLMVPLTGWYQDAPFIVSMDWLLGHISESWYHAIAAQPKPLLFRDPFIVAKDFISYLGQYDLLFPLALRALVILIGIIFVATITCIYTSFFLDKKDRLTHLKGRQLLKGKKAIKMMRKALKPMIAQSGKGIRIAPKVHISRETETKHFLNVGASGSGKTQQIKFMINQLVHEPDKMVIHDTKGDLTSSLPSSDFILLAPHDARSWAWDIAKDCRSLADAKELASRLIPKGTDETWAQGARQILTGLIRYLQLNVANTWDWKDLRDLSFSSPVKLQEFLDETYPEGARFIEVDPETGSPNKTSFSFLVSMWANVGSIVSPLAESWADVPDNRKVSLTAWLSAPQHQKRTLILQRSAQYCALSKAWIGAAIKLMSNHIAGPQFSDSTSRSIWMFLAEFAQLGKLEGFEQFLEVGRSKGIRCVIGVQDLEQLSDLYGKEALKTWLNSIETKLIFRMNAGPSAKFIAEELIGNREVSWKEKNVTHTSSGFMEDKPSTRSVNVQTRTATVPVIFPNDLEVELGPYVQGGEIKLRGLVLGCGGLYQMDWPITHWPNVRKASVPANWTMN